MGDPLSSLSAVIGLADVVIRSSVKLYSFFSELQDVPKDIKKLSESLLEWKSISKAIKDIFVRYQQSPFTVEDGLTLNGVSEALKSCEAALSAVDILIKKHGSGPSSKPARLAKDVKWILDTKKIQAAQQNLDRSRLALNTALSAITRFFGPFQ